jgi:hypothetical protein
LTKEKGEKTYPTSKKWGTVANDPQKAKVEHLRV